MLPGIIPTIFLGAGSAPWDGFPNIEAVNKNAPAAGTSITIDLPAGIQVGDLLIAGLVYAGSDSQTWPGGWSALRNANDASNIEMDFRYRIADGSEGASISVTIGSSRTCSCYSMRISHAFNEQPGNSEGGTGNSTTADPASVGIVGGGVVNGLFVLVAGRSAGIAPTGWPTNYVLNQDSINNGSACSLHVAARKLNASSDNAGVFTWAASARNMVFSFAVKPA